MKRKELIEKLETELRIAYSRIYVEYNDGSGLHARHNRLLKRYVDIVKELERVSLKWKIKKIIRRIKKLWPR